MKKLVGILVLLVIIIGYLFNGLEFVLGASVMLGALTLIALVIFNIGKYLSQKSGWRQRGYTHLKKLGFLPKPTEASMSVL